MDGLSIAASLLEVRRAAEGALVRTIHEPEPGRFLIGVFGQGNHAFAVSPSDADIHVTRLAYRNPERPSSFVMQLRKHLRGARITRIRQQGWERAVEISAIRNEGGVRLEATLVAELTGLRGNLLLLNAEQLVLGTLRQDPRNPVGRPYEPLPDQPKSDPRTVTIDALGAILASDVPARSLARGLDGIGRRTAEDVAAMAAASGGASDPARVREALDLVVSCVDAPTPYADPLLGIATFYPPPEPASEHAVRVASFGEALDLAVRRGGAERAEVAPSPVRERLDAHEVRATRDRLLNAIGRATRTQRALRQWLDAASDAADMRRRADFLLVHAADLGRGTTQVSGLDPATGEPLSFPVVARMSGMENAQALFRKARKLDRGRPTVAARLVRVERELERLRAALADSDAGRPVDDAWVAPSRRRPAAGPPAEPAGPRRFEIDGYLVLVGRNASQNDELMRRARPDDVWLHARDVAGSHVVICREGPAEIPRRVLEEAARLAARHSKADRRGKVAVTWAEARHVKKPRRGAPGLAIVTNENTLTIDVTEPT